MSLDILLGMCYVHNYVLPHPQFYFQQDLKVIDVLVGLVCGDKLALSLKLEAVSGE